MSQTDLLQAIDIAGAAARLRPYLPPTPTQPSPAVEEIVGGPVLLKIEMAQPTRVFKVRGALNLMLGLQERQRPRGVVAASAGNHGLAVAYAAQMFSIPATIFVPEAANQAKVRAMTLQGARVVQKGKDFHEALEFAQAYAAEQEHFFAHPFDDPAVISGQGTLGLELAQLDTEFDAVVVPIGGGGLIGGTACALKRQKPRVKVVGVAMQGADSMVRSLSAGKVRTLDGVHTIADGLAPRSPSERTLELVRRYVDDIVVIEDRDLFPAMRTLLFEEHLVAEPSGAAALAAILRHGHDRFGRRPVAVLTGGNCSDEVLAQVAVLE